jgi:flagella basal body P-ring formation protein FlgA
VAIGFLSAAVLSSAISCSSVLHESAAGETADSSLVRASQWQASFCKKYESGYDDVVFEVITERRTIGSNAQEESLGTLIIEPVRGGRTKLSWAAGSSSLTIWLKVSMRQLVWAVNKSLAPGSDINAGDVQQVMADVAPLMGISKLAMESPVGKTTLKQLRKGDVVTADTSAPPPVVKRNENVQVVVRTGSLQISSPGLALDTGWNVGDLIPVKVENAEGPTKARVMGKGNVVIEI